VFARWIFPFLVWPMLAMAAEPETEAVLKEPVKFDLVINGKRIGETKVAAGAKVQVVQRDGPRVLIRHGKSQDVWVQESQLEGVGKHDPQKDLDEGKALLNGEDKDGNWERGVELIRRAAEAGIPAGQREWGLLLLDGFCVKQDSAKGKALLLQAAEAGDGRAILESSTFARGSDGMRELMAKAADKGDPTAMVMVAENVLAGVDKQRDARALLIQAAESGDGPAAAAAGIRFARAMQNAELRDKLGMSVGELQAKAVESLRAAVEKGTPEAYIGLAQMLRTGAGMTKDESEADRLLAEFRRRCEQRIAKGSIIARISLVVSLRGTPSEPGREESLRLLEEVIANSDYEPHKNTAHAFASDVYVREKNKTPEDVRAAIKWLETSPSQSFREAQKHRIEQLQKTLAELESAQPKAE